MKLLKHILTLTLLSAAICFADVITGPITVTGNAVVGATTIVFNPDATVQTSDGCSVGGPACTPSDSNPALGSSVTIMGLTQAEVGTPISIPSWLTVGDVSLDATFVYPGIDSQAAIGTPPCGITDGAPGDTCTPLIGGHPSAFNLQDVSPSGFTASFAVSGLATDLAPGGGVDRFTATFTTPTANFPYQTLLADFATNPAFTYTATYSVDITFTPIPEPSYLPILGGVAVLGLFAALYRKKTRTV